MGPIVSQSLILPAHSSLETRGTNQSLHGQMPGMKGSLWRKPTVCRVQMSRQPCRCRSLSAGTNTVHPVIEPYTTDFTLMECLCFVLSGNGHRIPNGLPRARYYSCSVNITAIRCAPGTYRWTEEIEEISYLPVVAMSSADRYFASQPSIAKGIRASGGAAHVFKLHATADRLKARPSA